MIVFWDVTLWDVFFCAMITWLFYISFLNSRRVDRLEEAACAAGVRERSVVNVARGLAAETRVVMDRSGAIATPSDFEREQRERVAGGLCSVCDDRGCSVCCPDPDAPQPKVKP